MNKEPVAYILCYTIRKPQSGLDASPFKISYIDNDYWHIYCETTKEGVTPVAQAKYALKKLLENPNLYTWNIAKLIKSSEHYK